MEIHVTASDKKGMIILEYYYYSENPISFVFMLLWFYRFCLNNFELSKLQNLVLLICLGRIVQITMVIDKFQAQGLQISKGVLNDLLAASSVKESLLPSRNFLLPAEIFLDRTYFPSFDRSFWGWYTPDPGTSVAKSTNQYLICKISVILVG